MEKSFEQIEMLWQQQDERLKRIEHVQQESVRRLLHRSITSTHRRFLIENICGVVFGLLVEIFVLLKAEMCFSSWGLAIPYLIFNVLYLSSIIWIAVWAVRFWKHNPLTAPTVDALRFADRWHLAMKRSLIWGFGVVLPICIAASLPIFTYIFSYRPFHYSDLLRMSPLQHIIAVLMYAAFIGYAVYEMKLIRDLKENLKIYDELLEK
ncbi:MAG: hypothetical protein J6W84_09385 [Bacteroidales bacterium]|nr:hypothetical protein [Bacteroidales bacterium]